MSVRAEAVRRAAAVRAERAARIAAREAEISAYLADFFAEVARAEQVTAVAHRRCEEIMGQAQASVARAHQAAGTALRQLEGLGVTRSEIGELTGVNARELRDLMATRDGAGPASTATDRPPTSDCVPGDVRERPLATQNGAAAVVTVEVQAPTAATGTGEDVRVSTPPGNDMASSDASETSIPSGPTAPLSSRSFEGDRRDGVLA